MTNTERAKAFLRAIETRDNSISFYADDVVQQEFPNRLVPNGATRSLAQLAAGREKGMMVVSNENYEVVHTMESGNDVALEVIWTANVNVPIGELKPGGQIRAHFGVFMTFRDGKIVSQRNYDCFDPF